MANNNEINYDDERLTQVESEKEAALSELDQTYDGMIADSDRFTQQQIDATKAWEEKQTEIQNEKTNFAIEQIEQQKDQTKKDYIKEQSGAYVDWRKQSNEYGVKAEEMASAGLRDTGYSESSQVSMYNTYQNRVAVARESFNRAVLNYDNAIKDARLQNNAVLAEIAYNSLEKQTELAVQNFQYKNTLITQKTDKKLETKNMFHNWYQDVLGQINTEKALAEETRQFNEQMKLEKEKFKYQKKKDAEAKKAANASRSYSGGGGSSGGSSGGGLNIGGSGGGSGSGSSSSSKTPINKKTTKDRAAEDNAQLGAATYLDAAIASGASKSDVAGILNDATNKGVITKEERAALGNIYLPKGHEYT
jgi:hypothetical protein